MTDYSAWPVVGKGTERICYENPDDSGTCVKITYKTRLKQTLRENDYFRNLKKKGVPFSHLPEYYGEVKGDGYAGIVQELICDIDENGKKSPSPTIKGFFREARSPEEIDTLWKALADLKEYLFRYNILALGIDHNNVVLQTKNGKMRAVLIDGVYNTEFIPVSEMFGFLAHRKIRKRWQVFMDKLKVRFPQLFERHDGL